MEVSLPVSLSINHQNEEQKDIYFILQEKEENATLLSFGEIFNKMF